MLRAGSGGGFCNREAARMAPALARAAVAVGIDGLFLEVHEDPSKALSDGATSWPLDQLSSLLEQLRAIEHAVRDR